MSCQREGSAIVVAVSKDMVARFVRLLAACVIALAGILFCDAASAQDNNPPSFTSDSAVSVAENTTAVVTVAASDTDSADEVTGYSKSGGADESKFSLTTAGVLSFSTAPDFENATDTGGNNTYVVEVTATSGAGDRAMSATQTITVTVTNVNEAPAFSASAQTLSVAENTDTDTDIGGELPAATDPDASDSPSYSLGGTDAASFTLSGRQLKTNAALDYEDKTSYSVTLVATDGGNLTASLSVTVNVTDVNDVAPMFADSAATREVAENTASGQNIGAALPAADDPDTVGSLTYTLEGTDASSFTFDASNRRLKTKTVFNFEGTKKQYSVTVRVSDAVNTDDTLAVTINVTNVNEAPAFSASAQTRSVAENTAAETDIGDALPAATDVDAGDSVSYSLGGTDRDSFTLTSGRQLETKAALNYEDKTSYSVTLIATDGGNLTASLSVTVNVTDLNDVAPEFANSTETRSVEENTAAGQNIGAKLEATDPDTVGSLTYTLEGTDASSFTFDTSTLFLKTKAALDFEAPKKQYSVTVRVSDAVNTDDTVAVTINVTNVNEAPAFGSSTATLSVAENTATGQNIGAALTATDPDGDSPTYSVSGSVFGIDSSTGQLKTSGALNHEDTASYTVTVTARDGAATPLSGTITVTINVTDVNEPPKFAADSVTRSVDENTSTATEFGGAVAATDPDDGDTPAYTVGGTDGASFGINPATGRLKTKAALDFEDKNSYTVTVTASDGQTPALTATATVTINVGDVDEPPDPPASPAVSAQTSSRITVGWTAPSNTGRPDITGYKLSWTTTVADPVSPPPATPRSLVASVTSYVARGLDPATTYTFSVLATNDEGDGTAATVDGTTGANRAPVPRDASPEFSFAENSAADLAVGTVSATDPETDADDNNRPVTYAMKSGDTDAFSLNTNTGALTTKEFDYNYEAKSRYSLTVSANDVHGGSADIDVTVDLTDVGGEVPAAPDPPALDRTGTRMAVRYTAPANPGPQITGYSVRYRRTDTDPVGGWSSSGCGAHPQSENTFLCRNLVASGEYDFQVQARNADGAGAWSESAQTDNDPPVFDADLSGKSWAVPENTGAGVNVGDPVTATDPDNGSVTYYLEKRFTSDPAPPYTIGTASGQLATITGHTYDHEARPQGHSFYVVAKDPAGGIARFYLTVFISDVNEPPTSIPGSLKVTASPGGRFDVSWSAAADEEQKPPVKGYDIRYRTPYGSGIWETHRSTRIVVTHEGNVPATSTTITGLTVGSEYQVQIAARNSEGADAWSDSVRETAIGNQLPVFTDGASATRSVAENTPAGRDVGAPVAATDGDNGDLAYSLEGTDADSFTIGGGNGQIRTKAGVTYNFEGKNTYEVTVRVDDGQGGHATIDVAINLTDVEEDLVAPAAPTFPTSTDTTMTVEWTPPEDTGSPVTGYIVQYRLQAAGQVWRSVRPAGTETTVTITGLTAENVYEVRVRSVHGSESSPWSETSDIALGATTITFKDGSSTSRDLPENTAAGVALGADMEATISGFPLRLIGFSLGGPDADAFELETPADGSARLVTTDVGYDHEVKASYSVTVIATIGVLTASLTVDIAVTDDDTEAPSAPRPPSVQPESVTSLVVRWVEPVNTGPDITNYNLQYREQSAASWTPLNSLGTVLTTTISSLTQGTTYEVQVQAVNDEGTGDWSESGTGEPGDPIPNVLPVFVESPPVTRQVPENSGAGVAVGSPVTATDEGTSITYGLEGADSSAFTITDTGQIQTTGDGYDHEAKPSYSVTVTATDDREGVSRLDVTIEVEDLPEAPDAPGTPAVAAASPVSVTATWTAPADNAGRRPIAGYEVQYRTPPATGTWQDWPHPGTALTGTITELESGTLYEVQVRAINDDGAGDAELPGPWSAGTGATSPNQPPSFAEGPSASRSLAENPQADAAIGAPVAATDPENHALGYTLEGEDGGSFAIEAGGVLRTLAAEVYDFEEKPSYSLVVVATDEFGAAARIAVTVDLVNAPEPPSAPEPPTVSALSVSSVEATWPAPANTGPAISGYAVRYRIAGSTAGFTDAAYDDASLARSITLTDLVTETTYEVQVQATNGEGTSPWSESGTGAPSSDLPPVFVDAAPVIRQVVENPGAGTPVGAPVRATDPEGGPVTFALSGVDADAFSIDRATGQIRTVAGVVYNHDIRPSYAVSVTATDGRGGARTIDVTINLLAASRLSIEAAAAAEDAGVMTFAVTLAPPSSLPVSVDWSTADGTATAGGDYRTGSGTLTFAPGETAKTIRVTLVDDSVSEDDETFTVTLSNPLNAAIPADAATGTIADDDGEVTPEPERRRISREWLAQFVRSLSTDVLDMLDERLRDGARSSQLTLGGYRVGGVAPDGGGRRWPVWPAGGFAGHDGEERSGARTMTSRDLLLGTSFHLTTPDRPDGAGRWSGWGRVSPMRFGGVGGAVGDGITGVLGADHENRWLRAGVALSFSDVAGSHDGHGIKGSLMGVHPYARYALSDRFSLWSVLGYGSGALTLTESTEAGDAEGRRTEVGMSLVSLGARRLLASVHGFDVALKTDAFNSRMTVAAAPGHLAAVAAEASRLRMLVEGSRTDGALSSSFEAGVRRDGGDDRTGTGVEFGATVGYAGALSGIEASARLRGFVADNGAEEWGAAGTLSYAPGVAGRGVRAAVSPSWGTVPGGTGDLWSRKEMAEPAAAGPQGRVAGWLGYGLHAPSAGGLVTLVTPFVELKWSDRKELRLRGGVTLTGLGMVDGIRAELAGEHVESGASESEYRIGLTLTLPLGRGQGRRNAP